MIVIGVGGARRFVNWERPVRRECFRGGEVCKLEEAGKEVVRFVKWKKLVMKSIVSEEGCWKGFQSP